MRCQRCGIEIDEENRVLCGPMENNCWEESGAVYGDPDSFRHYRHTANMVDFPYTEEQLDDLANYAEPLWEFIEELILRKEPKTRLNWLVRVIEQVKKEEDER